MTPSSYRRNRVSRTLLATALLGCMAMAAGSVQAQSANANLRGTVAGVSEPTTVTAKNIATGATRTTTTNAQGSYSLTGLPPGTYTVNAGGSEQTVTLSVASTGTLNLQGGGGAATPETPAQGPVTDIATVQVTAPALQDMRKSEVGASVSLKQINTVPQITRNFLEFADAVPGMVFERDGQGRTTLKGGAQGPSGGNLYIDGIGQKSYVKGGGATGQFDSAGNPFPQSAIGEYKVISSGYKAEFGQVSSAAIVAATKSGSNDLKGGIFYGTTQDNWRARTAPETAPGAKKAESKETEYGFSVGGPLIEDKMHFFVAVERKEFQLPTVVQPDGEIPADANLAGLIPAEAFAEFGPNSQPFEEELYFAKIDWDVTDRDHIALAGSWRDESTIGNVRGQNAYSHGIETQNYDHRFYLRWEHSADNWFNEVVATHEDAFNNPTPLTMGNGYMYDYQLAGGQVKPIIRTAGGDPRAGQVKGQKGWSLSDNLTINLMDHTIKMGVSYKSIDLYAADALNANPQFAYLYNGSEYTATDQPYKAIFPKPVTGVGGLSSAVETTAKQYAFYIQDDWQVNEHLLLNLGVRWDYEKVPAYLDFVTPQNVIDGFNSQDPNAPAGQTYAQTLALGGVNVNNYISNGRNRKAFKDAWQPRLGFSYDIGADEKHVIHGGAGRSYDRNLYDYLQLELTKSALPQLTVYFRDPATGDCYNSEASCFDWNPNYLNGLENLQALVAASNEGVEVDLMNNKLKVPYSDQYSLGMSNQLGDWTTDATVSRIISKNGFAFSLGNRFPNGNFFNNQQACNPGAENPTVNQPWGCPIPGFGSLIIGSNGIETKSTQVLLSASKPYTKESGWAATFAYTYTSAEQNRDIGEHYSFDYATIGDYPWLVSNSVPRHRLVATGTLDGPWGLTFGGKVTLATPTPAYGTFCYPDEFVPAPNVGRCTPQSARPDTTLGYKSVDLQVTKNWEAGGLDLFARLDLLNAFDWKNYDAYTTTYPNDRASVRYTPYGNITGVPRMVKLQVGVNF